MLTADCQNSVNLISNPSLLFHLPQTAPHRAQLVYFMTSILKVVIEHRSQQHSHGTELLAYGRVLQLQTMSHAGSTEHNIVIVSKGACDGQSLGFALVLLAPALNMLLSLQKAALQCGI